MWSAEITTFLKHTKLQFENSSLQDTRYFPMWAQNAGTLFCSFLGHNRILFRPFELSPCCKFTALCSRRLWLLHGSNGPNQSVLVLLVAAILRKQLSSCKTDGVEVAGGALLMALFFMSCIICVSIIMRLWVFSHLTYSDSAALQWDIYLFNEYQRKHLRNLMIRVMLRTLFMNSAERSFVENASTLSSPARHGEHVSADTTDIYRQGDRSSQSLWKPLTHMYFSPVGSDNESFTILMLVLGKYLLNLTSSYCQLS